MRVTDDNGGECVVEQTAHLIDKKEKRKRNRMGSHNPLWGHTAIDLSTIHTTLSPKGPQYLRRASSWGSSL